PSSSLLFFFESHGTHQALHSFPTRRSSDLSTHIMSEVEAVCGRVIIIARGKIAVDERLDRLQAESTIVLEARGPADAIRRGLERSEEHTSELQSPCNLVCRLLLEKKNRNNT